MPRIIIISTVLTFDYTEFVQLTSIMQSTFYPCAQMTVACFQQASQMRITSLQPLLVSNLKVVDLFLILTWHDLHAFYRSQQAWAVSPSSGSVQFIFADENVKMSLKEVFKHADKRLMMLSDIGVPNWCVCLLDQYEHNCVTYAKNMCRRVISCLCMDYVFLSRLRRNIVKEVISIKMWHKRLWRGGWKELISWFAPKDDPAQEFECYVPTYVCRRHSSMNVQDRDSPLI